jgi:hypothetical protein
LAGFGSKSRRTLDVGFITPLLTQLRNTLSVLSAGRGGGRGVLSRRDGVQTSGQTNTQRG